MTEWSTTRAAARPIHWLVRRVRWMLRSTALAAGSLATVAIAAATLLLAAGLDWVDPLSDHARYACFGLALATLVGCLARFVVLPQWRRWPATKVARRIEAALPGMNGRLVSVVELTMSNGAALHSATSPAFLNRLLDETSARLNNVPMTKVVPLVPLRKSAWAAAGAVALVAIAFGALGVGVTTAAARVLLPWRDIAPATGVEFGVAPGDASVLRGDNLEIGIDVKAGQVAQVEVELFHHDGRKTLQAAQESAPGAWSYTVAGIERPIGYRIIGGGTWTRRFQVVVVDRPRMTGVRTTVHFPDYMALASKQASALSEMPAANERGVGASFPSAASGASMDRDAVDVVGPFGSRIETIVRAEGAVSSASIALLDARQVQRANPRRRERVWFADRLPGDAKKTGTWRWAETPRGRAHCGELRAGFSRHGLETVQNAFAVESDDWLFIDSLPPPAAVRSLALQFKIGDAWENAVHWGAEPRPGNSSRRLGDLPARTAWGRLEFPASSAGLAGKTTSGIRFQSTGAEWQVLALGAIEPPTRLVEQFEPFQHIAMNRTQDGTWHGEFPLHKTIRYRIHLRDNAGRENLQKAPAVAAAVRDLPPAVRLDRADAELVLAESAQAPLNIAADDDYGLAELRVAWWRPPMESQPAAPTSGRQRGVERVWFVDRLPDGAKTAGEWRWEAAGDVGAHFHTAARNLATHDFSGALGGFRVYPGDRLFAEVLLPHDLKPASVMLAFHDGIDWEHRAFWGEDRIGIGRPRSNGRRRAGELPGLGEWVRIEVAAAAVGLEGRTLRGMAFMSWGGTFKTRRVGAVSIQRQLPAVVRAAATAVAPAAARRMVLKRYPEPVTRDRLQCLLSAADLQCKPGEMVDCVVEAVDRKGQIGQSQLQRIRVEAAAAGTNRWLEQLAEQLRSAGNRLAEAAAQQADIGNRLRALKRASEKADDTAAREWAKLLDKLSREQEANRGRVDKARAELARAAKAAENQRSMPREFAQRLEAMANAQLADAKARMEDLANALKEQAKSSQASDLQAAREVEESIERSLDQAQAELKAMSKAAAAAKKSPSNAMAQMQQAIRQQAGERAGKDLDELRNFAAKLSTALQEESQKQKDEKSAADTAAADQLLSKARQLLDMPEQPPDPAKEEFRPGIANGKAKPDRAPGPKSSGENNSASDRGDRNAGEAPSKPAPPASSESKSRSPLQRKLNQAGASLAADAAAADQLARKWAEALKSGPAGASALRRLGVDPALQRALAMVDRMRMMQMEAMAQTNGKSGAQSKPGKMGKAARVRQAGAMANRSGESFGATALDALGQLDVATQNALMALQPKLREQILEGIKEQGPEPWRPLIREYFERLAREPGASR